MSEHSGHQKFLCALDLGESVFTAIIFPTTKTCDINILMGVTRADIILYVKYISETNAFQN